MTSKRRFIIGIWWGYCSGASLFEYCADSNGWNVRGAVSEERFRNIKNCSHFPSKTLDWLMKEYAVKKGEIENVVFTANDAGVEHILVNSTHYFGYTGGA